MGPLLIGFALVLAPEAFGHHDCCYFFELVQSMRWIGFEELRWDTGSVAPKQDGLIIAQRSFAIVSIKHGPPTPSGILKTRRPIGSCTVVSWRAVTKETRQSNGDNSPARISVGRKGYRDWEGFNQRATNDVVVSPLTLTVYSIPGSNSEPKGTMVSTIG